MRFADQIVSAVVARVAEKSGALNYADLCGAAQAIVSLRGELPDAELLDMLAEEVTKFEHAIEK